MAYTELVEDREHVFHQGAAPGTAFDQLPFSSVTRIGQLVIDPYADHFAKELRELRGCDKVSLVAENLKNPKLYMKNKVTCLESLNPP